jgi:hypothetical protein
MRSLSPFYNGHNMLYSLDGCITLRFLRSSLYVVFLILKRYIYTPYRSLYLDSNLLRTSLHPRPILPTSSSALRSNIRSAVDQSISPPLILLRSPRSTPITFPVSLIGTFLLSLSSISARLRRPLPSPMLFWDPMTLLPQYRVTMT